MSYLFVFSLSACVCVCLWARIQRVYRWECERVEWVRVKRLRQHIQVWLNKDISIQNGVRFRAKEPYMCLSFTHSASLLRSHKLTSTKQILLAHVSVSAQRSIVLYNNTSLHAHPIDCIFDDERCRHFSTLSSSAHFHCYFVRLLALLLHVLSFFLIHQLWSRLVRMRPHFTTSNIVLALLLKANNWSYCCLLSPTQAHSHTLFQRRLSHIFFFQRRENSQIMCLKITWLIFSFISVMFSWKSFFF